MKVIRVDHIARRSIAAATALIASAPAAFAQTLNAGGVAEKLTGQVDSVGKLVIMGAGLVGVILVGAGLLKLKQAADTGGQQVKYGEGLWRLVVGAGLVALPAVTGVLTASFGFDAAAVQIGTMF